MTASEREQASFASRPEETGSVLEGANLVHPGVSESVSDHSEQPAIKISAESNDPFVKIAHGRKPTETADADVHYENGRPVEYRDGFRVEV